MKNRIVTIIVILVLLVLALTSGFVLVWRLFFLSVLVLVVSYLWAYLGIRGITGEVNKSAEYCQVGEWFAEEVTVFNKSKLPKLLVKVQENASMPAHHNMAAFNLSPNSSYCWQSKIYCRRRGRYSLGTFTATVADPFGLFSLCCNFGEPKSILVYPTTLELPLFQPLTSNERGHGPSYWLASEVGPSAARVREYTTGDTFKRIHWRSVAHTGRLMVKEFDADRSDYAFKDIWIIPDMHEASQLGNGEETTEEYCITIAASLVKKYIDSGEQVGLIASGDQHYLFQPERTVQHLWNMLEALALMKATGEVPIYQLISEQIGHIGSSSAIIVITPSTSERTFSYFRHLKDCGVMVIVILLDCASFSGAVNIERVDRSLISSDVQVYIIRRGDDLVKALCS